MVTSTSRGFSAPFRYVQGPGELNRLPEYAKIYGQKMAIVIDGFLYDEISSRLERIFAHSDCSIQTIPFGGECSRTEINRVTEIARESKAQIITGIGGGKTLDTAKMVGVNLKLAQFIIPSSASTDAPTSSMSVIYQETGEHLQCVCHNKGSDLVLVDSEIIAKAPLRLFVAGMGDALSTFFEARANALSDTPNYIGTGYRRCKAGMAIAKMCYDILMEDGLKAKIALENGARSEALENVIEANILLSGLGFENTGCAGAHAIHTGFSEIPSAHTCYHGEVVAFGVLFQLVMENAPQEEFDQVMRFCIDIGLPVTLSQLQVEPTPENIGIIADRVLDGNSGVEAEPFLVTKDLVYQAILTADAFGRRYLSKFR